MILDTAKSYLVKEVAPLANEIDINSDVLLKALKGLGNLGLLALRVPQQWGGYGVSDEVFASFQELVARYSGALAFLQTQHQSAAGMLVQSRNSALQQAYLPHMGNGDVLLGVGFSHIRRLGDPTTVAIPVAGGYQIDGFVPWVTGWNLFSEFIVAATLADGGAVFGIVAFVETQQATGGAIAFGTPMQLASMRSTSTLSATLTRFFLPSDRVVFIKPAEWIHNNDIKNILRATPLAIGCAMAGLDIIQAAAQAKSLAFIDEAFTALDRELSECREAIAQAHYSTFTQKVRLRAWAIDLAVRTAHAAITVSSGSANNSDRPAQRVYREALVYTVSGQTPAIMEATLKQLTSPQRYHPKSQNITYSQVIHLSHVIHPDIPQWLGDPPVEFETVAELNQDGYYLRRFSLGEHTATHINAPKSFYTDGVGIDQYPANLLVVPAVVLNIKAQAANPDYTLSVADILTWEQQHGEIEPGGVVLLYTGWQNKWWDKAAFLNADSSSNLHFPGFSKNATQFLLQRQIAGVGIDTHGVDPGQDTMLTTNRLVLEKPRIVLENLTNLDQLPIRGTTLAIGILRLQNGSGSPAAVMAFVP
ncbi:cyclase family protein [Gloeocapsopsis crepidinum LEGE 06123]|uniref:Cyclase family protein n=1 Tax=Gloeocapsopsis crepidinum LEGE 06123 TaxID=588587 RepID=A0ABR9ULX6_9CHRO|nr:cyclase family protein [Gloeocapsopsis crepidinum]MBE9189284.1 cyclase family protein [Gloeocapsopsis crepidinum LEGE 06123]